ncbi:hypothetical protein [Ureaplasma urealyticum]|uniref:Uncharacterized protein n=3 Tax=Ureaplasma urealyticum TaxID=2130 RepID=A0AAP9D7E2_UREUR|nr:hypothetical protein [Ureaplasma urealyticum]EDX53964.1 hypothetical protein UUR9_0048 [Ureaplasma urealyticum serovar 9 str. ATCC 33175]ACI60185.1 conserved hypothetical protein [Ureaplasma urealyticum serovar 10 str. ATCC 33699]EDT49650.1 hypothetical protein UUR13_0238 [Ureaplasma urealyticum serovar 13 str. ATCC 33698]EDU06087.1 hypothetical protein UUR5_A0044 [Ureaplasma urealyticum serovar 5 str. ATCC 27817]EDU56950.1 hypothetical protein UUR7_0275 [Ureaplasma urealyticum serovar 7 st
MSTKAFNPKERVTKTVVLSDLDQHQNYSKKHKKMDFKKRVVLSIFLILLTCGAIILLVFVITELFRLSA